MLQLILYFNYTSIQHLKLPELQGELPIYHFFYRFMLIMWFKRQKTLLIVDRGMDK